MNTPCSPIQLNFFLNYPPFRWSSSNSHFKRGFLEIFDLIYEYFWVCKNSKSRKNKSNTIDTQCLRCFFHSICVCRPLYLLIKTNLLRHWGLWIHFHGLQGMNWAWKWLPVQADPVDPEKERRKEKRRKRKRKWNLWNDILACEMCFNLSIRFKHEI